MKDQSKELERPKPMFAHSIPDHPDIKKWITYADQLEEKIKELEAIALDNPDRSAYVKSQKSDRLRFSELCQKQESQIQSLEDELEEIKESGEFQHGLDSGVYVAETEIEKLQSQIKALEFLNKTAPTTMLEDEIKELSRERVLIKSEAKRQKGNGHNCDLTILIEQLLNSK